MVGGGGGQPLVAPTPARKPVSLKESEKDRIFEHKRAAGTNETPVGLVDSTGRAPARLPPVHPLRNPYDDKGILISSPTESQVHSAPVLAGEQAASGPLMEVPKAPSTTDTKSLAPTLSVVAEEF